MKLEKLHHSLRHFGNRGMRRSLADALSLAGLCEWNARIRYRHRILRNKKLRDSIPFQFRDSPSHRNHSHLNLINHQGPACRPEDRCAFKCGIIAKYNGEVFI